jgi:hypothetical protein
MWSLFKMLVCLGLVGYFLPPDMRPPLTLDKSALPCENKESCVKKIESSLLDEGLKSISVFFKGYEAPVKAKLSNGKNTQSTLSPSDLETPWQGPERKRRP